MVNNVNVTSSHERNVLIALPVALGVGFVAARQVLVTASFLVALAADKDALIP